jgi:DNA adenine methylase
MEDHKRLARLLNASSAYLVLSYYPHPLLDELYPDEKWRRITWETPKHADKTKNSRDKATEMLLCNYHAAQQTLFNLEETA